MGWEPKSRREKEDVCRNGVSRVNFSKYTQNGPSILASASLVTERQLTLEPKIKQGPSLLFQCSAHEHSCSRHLPFRCSTAPGETADGMFLCELHLKTKQSGH